MALTPIVQDGPARGASLAWFRRALRRLHLVRATPLPLHPEGLRSRLGPHQLHEALSKMVHQLNEREKRVIVREYVYEQSDGLRCVYVYPTNQTGYTMTLNLLGSDSSLVFSLRHPEPEAGVHSGESAAEYGLTKVECELPIYSTVITKAEMDRWLKYLVSGFQRRFKPCPYKAPYKKLD